MDSSSSSAERSNYYYYYYYYYLADVNTPVEDTAKHILADRGLENIARELAHSVTSIDAASSLEDLNDGLLSLDLENLHLLRLSYEAKQNRPERLKGKISIKSIH